VRNSICGLGVGREPMKRMLAEFGESLGNADRFNFGPQFNVAMLVNPCRGNLARKIVVRRGAKGLIGGRLRKSPRGSKSRAPDFRKDYKLITVRQNAETRSKYFYFRGKKNYWKISRETGGSRTKKMVRSSPGMGSVLKRKDKGVPRKIGHANAPPKSGLARGPGHLKPAKFRREGDSMRINKLPKKKIPDLY